MPPWDEDDPIGWLDIITDLLTPYEPSPIDVRLILQSRMGAKARDVLRSMPPADAGSFLKVQEMLAMAYRVTPEQRKETWKSLQ